MHEQSFYLTILSISVSVLIISLVVTEQNETCTSGSVRLVNGQTQYEGRVELCYDETWGAICPYTWDIREATVICRQLNFTTIGKYTNMSNSKKIIN